jgi:hypothetical protein
MAPSIANEIYLIILLAGHVLQVLIRTAGLLRESA